MTEFSGRWLVLGVAILLSSGSKAFGHSRAAILHTGQPFYPLFTPYVTFLARGFIPILGPNSSFLGNPRASPLAYPMIPGHPLALRYRSQDAVIEAVARIRQLLPFALLGFDTDNGSEFLNETVLDYCQREGITFTHGRAYKKNDQCFVEQKNGSDTVGEPIGTILRVRASAGKVAAAEPSCHHSEKEVRHVTQAEFDPTHSRGNSACGPRRLSERECGDENTR